MKNCPSYSELWERCERIDDAICDAMGDDSDLELWEILGLLRSGTYCKTEDEAVFCPECGHINGLGHSCEMWAEDNKSTGVGFWHPEPEDKFLITAHRQVAKTANWDTKMRCSCGAVFASGCEMYMHQTAAYLLLLEAPIFHFDDQAEEIS